VQTTRLATSFDTLTRSVTRTGAEIFPRMQEVCRYEEIGRNFHGKRPSI